MTTLSFGLSAVMCAVIAWRGYRIWAYEGKTHISEAFYKAFIAFAMYTGIRALASAFFFESSTWLSVAYALSHVFQGVAAAYIMRMAMVGIFNISLARSFFFGVVFLYISKIALNVVYPSSPYFDNSLNVIHWGQHPYVAILHASLLSMVLLTALGIFISLAIKYWGRSKVGLRSFLISMALLMSIGILVVRTFIESPMALFASEVSFVLAFGFMLWAVSIKDNVDNAT